MIVELVKYAEKHGANEEQLEILRQYEMMCGFEYWKFSGDKRRMGELKYAESNGHVNFELMNEKLVDLIRGRNALKALFGFRNENNRGYAWDAIEAQYQEGVQRWSGMLREQQEKLSEMNWAYAWQDSYGKQRGFEYEHYGQKLYYEMKEVCQSIAEHVIFGWIDAYASDPKVLAKEKREALK